MQLRRFLPDDELGKPDPEVIAEVTGQALPQFRNAHELHDFLVSIVLADEPMVSDCREFLEELIAGNRVSPCLWNGVKRGYVSAERLAVVRAMFERFETERTLPEIAPLRGESENPNTQDGVNLMLQGWMEILGPVTEDELAERFGFSIYQVQAGLATLEGKGLVLQGSYTAPGRQWCSRTLLMRIHRRTIAKLRKQIDPVTPVDYMRFLLRWQRLHPDTKLSGDQGLLEIVSQLQGLEFPLSSWEREILGNRLQPGLADLDRHFLNGSLVWCRTQRNENGQKTGKITKNFPFAIFEAGRNDGLESVTHPASVRSAW